MWMDMKDSNLSQSACVREDEDTTTLTTKCARRSVDVVAGVRIVRCHASIDVVIGIRVVLCHPLIDFPLLDFHFVPKFSTCCHAVIIHKKLLPLFFKHVLHRGNTSFKVWFYIFSDSVLCLGR